MVDTVDSECTQIEVDRDSVTPTLTALFAAAALASACSSGGQADGSSPTPEPPPPGPPPPSPPSPPTPLTADTTARFLGQASFGANNAEVDRTLAMGIDAWIDEQIAMPLGTTHLEWMRAQGYESATSSTSRLPLDYSIWRKFVSSPDSLRQRMVFALNQIFVVAIEGLGGEFPAFASGYFLDILEANAFGRYRTLLEQVTLSPAMGRYLSMRGSRKADSTGRRPDENYAREILQLFSIGLVQLEPDGTPKVAEGASLATYGEADVSGLARAFTGWDFVGASSTTVATRQITPMANIASRHETGEKTFLGLTIPAGTSANESLRLALDHIAAHPNVGPFIGKQLIQRFVSSNPSPAYVARVSAVFDNNGAGVRGDLGATLRAVLTDAEARDAAAARVSTTAGKLREPVIRFVQWARACNVSSASGQWKLGNLSDPATRLGQSPMHSPSVFNFYRPGYVPPGTPIAALGLVAPEFQITTETSVAGYLNFMQSAMSSTNGVLGSDALADHTEWLALVDDPAALTARANLLLAAGQLSAVSLNKITTALAAMNNTTATERLRRVWAALLLTMAAPEYLVQR